MLPKLALLFLVNNLKPKILVILTNPIRQLSFPTIQPAGHPSQPIGTFSNKQDTVIFQKQKLSVFVKNRCRLKNDTKGAKKGQTK